MKKIIIAVISVIVTALFLSTFIEKNNNDSKYDDNNVVVSVSDLNFDLKKTDDLSIDDKNVICATSRGLVKCNNNGEVIPDLVDNIEISKDGIEYNFILKDDIYWSDGKKISSEDVITYFKWLIKNESYEEISALLDIYGVTYFKEGKGSFEKDVAMTTDGNNIKVRLNKKCDDFLLELSKPQYKIRRNLGLWENIKENYKSISYSGYYYISSILDDKIELKSAEDSKKLIFVEDDNKEDAMASYEIGERDIIVDPPVSQVTRLDKVKSILSYPSGKGIYLAINPDNINISDRRQIIKEFYKIAEKYYEDNRKAVKFSEGSYFEKNMDELDKLQNRKVMINNSEDGDIPGSIDVLIEDNDFVENFSKAAESYFYDDENVNMEISKKEAEDITGLEDYDAVLFTSNENVNNKVELYSNILKFSNNKKDINVSSASNYIEDTLFNSYSIVPIVFINKSIAVSDKVSNVKLDGNGNIDFGAIN